MKVKILTGKYKSADDTWYKAGEIAELPEEEAKAAISGNAAIEAGVTPPVQNLTPVAEEVASRSGRQRKE